MLFPALHTTEPLPSAGSAPSGKDNLPGKADEPKNALVIAVGGTQNDEEPKKPEDDDDDEFTEAFFKHFYADQDISDSDESDDDEANAKPKELD